MKDRWRERPGAGSGIWYDLGAHLIDQSLTLFGMPVAVNVDLAQLRPGAQTTDYFHAVLIYPQRRVILHGTMLAPAGSSISKTACLRLREIISPITRAFTRPNPVSAEDAIRVMEIIEQGI
ncbi:Gfo/Idh/MocA family oxidoreductase [Sodalis glossinidius]|uniref:Gfo/Idh/MocA family oxidoreductase n=1 Tax=Sodalis glossinidius TaxID=63612 RepID=UPI00030835A5